MYYMLGCLRNFCFGLMVGICFCDVGVSWGIKDFISVVGPNGCERCIQWFRGVCVACGEFGVLGGGPRG